MAFNRRPQTEIDQQNDSGSQLLYVVRLIAGLLFNCAFLLFLIVSIPVIVFCWLFAY